MFLNLEFQKWKLSEEDKVGCRYVKVTRDIKKASGSIKRVFCCHRSGQYKPRGKDIRQLQVQGSCKLDHSCPAATHLETLSLGMNYGLDFKVYCI